MKNRYLIFLIVISGFVCSCGNFNQTNFNKQKFTTLKTKSTNNESIHSDETNSENLGNSYVEPTVVNEITETNIQSIFQLFYQG